MAQTSLNSTGVASSGALVLQTNGTTAAVTLGTDQSVTTANTINNLTVGRGAGSVSTNTAVGASALASNTSGTSIFAGGYFTLNKNTIGVANVGVGGGDGANNPTLYQNTTGSYNTAVGLLALGSNTTASNNTAVGYQAGYNNTTGAQGTYIGNVAGYSVTTGLQNQLFGYGAGYYITTGSKNTILGAYSGNNGGLDIRTASNHIVLSDGDGNPLIWIANGGDFKCPNIYTLTTANAANMYVFSDGSVRRSTSALKYKQDIRDLENIDIDLFRAVRYKSKSDADDQSKDHFGVIADEVAEAGITELVNYGADGEVEGFQYERLTVVLLKELQTLKAKVAALENK